MAGNLGNFDRQSRDASRRVVAEGEETIRSFALQLFTDLRTDAKTTEGYGAPVASGRLASSMRMGINTIDSSTAPADPDYQYPPGRGARPLPPRTIANPAISRTSALLRVFKLGDAIHISNSVPYIEDIERRRKSWQTPGGVFGPTVRRAVARFRNIRVRVFRV
jgi:hypothetical protein